LIKKIVLFLIFELMVAPASADTITFWHALSGSSGEAVEAQCKRFNSSQDNHKIICRNQGDYTRLMQKTIAAFRAGKQPTLVQFYDVALRDLIESNAVIPVSNLYKKKNESDWQFKLLPPIRDWYGDANGQMLGQPFNVSTVLLYVNDTQLGGLAPHTWEDLRKIAIKMRANGVRCPFVTDLDAWTILEQFSAVEGIELATPSNGQDSLNVQYKLNVKALATHIDWVVTGNKEGWLLVDSQTRAGDAASAFRSGECAMLLAATGMWSGFQNSIGKRQKISAHLLPSSKKNQRFRTNIGGGALYLLKGSTENQMEAASDFLRFIRQPQEQITFSKSTGFLPITEDALAIHENKSEAVVEGIRSLNFPSTSQAPPLRLGFYPQFRTAWKIELQRALEGKQDAKKTLARLETIGNQLLERFAKTFDSENK